MWINDHCKTVVLEFTVKEMKEYLQKIGYKFEEITKDYTDDQSTYEFTYTVPIFPEKLYGLKYWLNKDINHPNDPIRLVFETEMIKKLLN